MKRFISKIDHDMHILLNADKEKARELWEKIKNTKHILEYSIQITKDRVGNRSLFCPAICHMILSNPGDIDKKIYESFVSEVLRDNYLSRLTVADNLSFASLILLNGNKDLSILNSKLLNNEIRNKAIRKPYIQRYVIYNDVLGAGEDISASYKDDSLDVKLSSRQVHSYLNRDYMSIIEEVGFEEIDELMRYAMVNGELDLRLRDTIFKLYEDSLSYRVDFDQTYGIDEETPKL